MVLIAFLTVLFAACSMIYELFLAQTLTSVLGGTNLRYAATIGLYITSMGCGALLMDPLIRLVHRLLGAPGSAMHKERSAPGAGGLPLEALVLVEVVLMICGCLAIPYVLVLDRVTAGGLHSDALAWFRTLALHAPIVIIGVLSGLELPLLMRCARNLRLRAAHKAHHVIGAHTTEGQRPGDLAANFDAKTMAWDYVGTVIGAVVFPFVLLPRWGVVGVAALNVMGNAWGTVIAVLLLGDKRSRVRRTWLALAAVVFVVLSWCALAYRDVAEVTLVEQLYLLEQAP